MMCTSIWVASLLEALDIEETPVTLSVEIVPKQRPFTVQTYGRRVLDTVRKRICSDPIITHRN